MILVKLYVRESPLLSSWQSAQDAKRRIQEPLTSTVGQIGLNHPRAIQE
jgi:hypothetical protein